MDGIVEWSTPHKVSLVKSENSSGMSGFDLIIIGTVLLPNPNKEVMESL